MAQQCELCGKKPTTGNNVSHSNRHTRRRFNLNLQNKRFMVGTQTRRVRICTGCLRTVTKKFACC